MSHQEIFEKFMEIHPYLEGRIQEWFPSGKNRIRVRFISGTAWHRIGEGADWIFKPSKYNLHNWVFNPITDKYIESMKGGSSM